ncbi:MAG: hypothetical protein BMS9Abin02_2012 [Anaerolineae bacterium]|nr:MAG: hypothetical protein BMS9Abin02_2012 [Anaerolineae bacterium]
MKSIIQHIIEPQRLLLAWQAPEGKQRTRFIVGELIRKVGDDRSVMLRYLQESIDFQKAKNLGFDGHPAFKKTDRDYSHGVVDAFMRRLPPRTRRDFRQYLEQFCISRDANISDFALLGYTGAKLPSDGFSIIHPFDNVDGPCEFLTEVAGFRYMKDISLDDVVIGETVTFEPEPTNKYDPRAISILLNERKIGYVNRGQLDAFHYWLKHNQLQAHVERKNGTESRPLVYVFIEIRTSIHVSSKRVSQ